MLHFSRINIRRIHPVFAVFFGARHGRRRAEQIFFGESALVVWVFRIYSREAGQQIYFPSRPERSRMVIQMRLHSILSEFVVSSNVNVSGCVRRYLKEVISAYPFLTARLSSDYLCGIAQKRLPRDVIYIFSHTIVPYFVPWRPRERLVEASQENGKTFLFPSCKAIRYPSKLG